MKEKYVETIHTKKGYYANKLLNRIYTINKNLIKPIDLALVQKAIYYLQLAHDTSEKVNSNRAYNRPLVIALMLTDYYLVTESLVATLLYEILKEHKLTLEVIETEFGKKIADKVYEITNLCLDNSQDSLRQVERLVAADNKDILLIRLLDNLYTMQNICLESKWKQLELALYSLKVFLPLAVYLEIGTIENELAEIGKCVIIPELSKPQNAALSTDLNFAFLYL